jgi:hypothetical protein
MGEYSKSMENKRLAAKITWMCGTGGMCVPTGMVPVPVRMRMCVLLLRLLLCLLLLLQVQCFQVPLECLV